MSNSIYLQNDPKVSRHKCSDNEMIIGRDRFGVAVSAKCLIPGKTLTGAMCPGQAFTKPLCLLGTGSILKKKLFADICSDLECYLHALA